MDTLNDLSEIIAGDLDLSGFQREADDIRRFSNLANDPGEIASRRLSALRGLEDMTHVRWLGDLYLSHLSQEEWWGRLGRLKRIAKSMASKIN
jgi:hypothetical protein